MYFVNFVNRIQTCSAVITIAYHPTMDHAYIPYSGFISRVKFFREWLRLACFANKNFADGNFVSAMPYRRKARASGWGLGTSLALGE